MKKKNRLKISKVFTEGEMVDGFTKTFSATDSKGRSYEYSEVITDQSKKFYIRSK